MGEIVVLDAGKGQRMVVVHLVRAGQQRDGAVFPARPGQRTAQLLCGIVTGQAAVVGGDQIIVLIFRNRSQIILPQVRKHIGGTGLVEPGDFRFAQREDAAQHQFADAFGELFGIGQRQRAAPGAAKHQPLLGAQHQAQALDIADQMPGGVGLQAGVRRGTATAALVEQQHAVLLRIKQATVVGAAAAARTAMQEHRRLAGRIADQFPVDLVAVAGIEKTGLERLDRRIQFALVGVDIVVADVVLENRHAGLRSDSDKALL